MRQALQRQILYPIAIFLLCLLAVSATIAETSQTVVTPVIDRAGEDVYCTEVQDLLEAAQSSIDLLLAGAQVDQNPLLGELAEAKSRGVTVRVLLDSSDWAPSITEKNQRTIEYLTEQGINARLDDPAVTIHAKLAIIDRETVILGSSNWNKYSFNEQEQSNAIVEDERVGDIFSEYFDKLWQEELADGGVKLDSLSWGEEDQVIVPIADTVDSLNYVEVLLQLISQAKRSICVAMYRVSHYPQFPDSASNRILDAVIDAVARGVSVKMLIDDCSFYEDSKEANLNAALYLNLKGVDVRLDDPQDTTHTKLVIVDDESVLLGSTNWNYYSLEQNIETNIAIVHVPAVTAAYKAFFASLWQQGRKLCE